MYRHVLSCMICGMLHIQYVYMYAHKNLMMRLLVCVCVCVCSWIGRYLSLSYLRIPAISQSMLVKWSSSKHQLTS